MLENNASGVAMQTSLWLIKDMVGPIPIHHIYTQGGGFSMGGKKSY